jgi:probable F420-dependent oxidoreductase
MRFGVALQARYAVMPEITAAAEALGYESVWIPDHLIMPSRIGEVGPVTGDPHPPIDPTIPTMDNLMVLATLGQASRRLLLGTWVYNLALRHPFVAARAAQTLDLLSGGRFVFGVGAGWIPGEYEAAGVGFRSRGRRLEECIAVLRSLWLENEPSFDGEFFHFGPVRFEPKPVQLPIPIHIGGDSRAALRRAARLGDGWIGSWHTPESAADCVRQLRSLLAEAGRSAQGFEITVSAQQPSGREITRFAEAGVDRLLVAPWDRSRNAVAGLERYRAVIDPHVTGEDA